jgi:hypothetical protein
MSVQHVQIRKQQSNMYEAKVQKWLMELSIKKSIEIIEENKE